MSSRIEAVGASQKTRSIKGQYNNGKSFCREKDTILQPTHIIKVIYCHIINFLAKVDRGNSGFVQVDLMWL